MATSLQRYTQSYTDALDTGLEADKLEVARRVSQAIFEKKQKERAQYYAMVNKLLTVGMKGYTEWKEGTNRAKILNEEYKSRGIDAKANYNLLTGKLTGVGYDKDGNLIETEIIGGDTGIERNLLHLDDWKFDNSTLNDDTDYIDYDIDTDIDYSDKSMDFNIA